MIRVQQALITLVVAAVCLATSPAGATTLDPVTPEQLVRNAELIFEGEVVDVQYRMSEAGTGLAALPHTFVTFHLARRLKGDSEGGDFITLRLQGGPVADSDLALIIPGVPLFDLGTRSVLFVRGNGRADVPLVGWEQGRFRVVDGAIYTDEGREVWLDRGDAFVFGPARPLAEVMTHRMGEVTLGRALPQPEDGPTPPAGARRATTTAFADAVQRLVAKIHSAADLQRLPLQPSADPEAPLEVRAPRAIAPPEDIETAPTLQGEPDPVEEQMVLEGQDQLSGGT